MRILLIPSSYPPILGGLQTAAHSVALHLLRRGHEVQVVTKRRPRSLRLREVLEGVTAHRWLFLAPDFSDLQRGRLHLFLASFYFYPSTLFRLLCLMRAFRPDIVNVHFPEAQIPFVLWLRRRFDFRLVVTLHGDEIERWFGAERTTDREPRITRRRVRLSALRRLRMILQEADAVTACSRYLLDKAIQLEPSVARKGHVTYNGIDPERFGNKTSYCHPRPYILAFGRLTYKKGFDLLLEAFARVASEHSHADLILAGEGEERAALETQAQELGLAERMYFFGRATPEEVVRLLNGCLFVVVPSRWEPFGIVALEAVAAGKPVLASRVGGLIELLSVVCRSNSAVKEVVNLHRGFDDGTCDLDVRSRTLDPLALLVEPTVKELAKGMQELLARAKGTAAAKSLDESVLRDYSWAQVVNRYEKVFIDCCA